jgi:hypothetical protein
MRRLLKTPLHISDRQKDSALGLSIILAVAVLYYFQWAYYLTGLEGSKVNIDQPERYFWWANDSVTYRAAGEWLFGRDDNDMIGNRPWLYPFWLGLARTLFGGDAESALWFSQFLMWLASGAFLYLTLRNTSKSTPVAILGAGIFFSHPSPLILTFHGMTESMNFLLISIFCWLLTRNSKDRIHHALFALVLATVTKPIYLVHLVLLVGYIFLRERDEPRRRQAGTLVLIFIPIWIQLILSFIATGKPTVSGIGTFTFKDYFVADVYMQAEGTEWRETTALIADWTLQRQLSYLWENQRLTALTFRRHIIDNNLWTGSFFTLGEGNRTREFAMAFNAAAAYLHVLMAPLVIYYICSSRYNANREIAAILYLAMLVQILTSGISTGQEDRLLITAMPLWIVVYSLTLTGMHTPAGNVPEKSLG